MPEVQVNAVRFNYTVSGPAGGSWITFSNSLATNLSMWDDQAGRLAAAGWRVLRYDQRGHGLTEATPPPYSFARLGADVVGLWDALGVDASVYCGLSLGGTTGLGVALDHPARVRALVACDCRCDSPPGFRAAWDERIARARAGGMAGMAAPTVDRWFTAGSRDRQPAVIEKVEGMVATTALDGFIGCSRALQEIHFRDRLGDIAVPTCFTCGEHDPAAGPAYCRAMHEAVVGSRFEIVEAAGHISNLENPARFNAVLEGFLRLL